MKCIEKRTITTEQPQKTIRFEDLLTEKVYDNVHGFVYLTKFEKELLSHPYLKRLHFIKQNALACFVFPGATHTRFAHSIGVLHIAEKIIQRLKKVGRDLIKINQLDHQVIRLAALLHDIGHYPLSHTLEASYQETQYLFDNNTTTNILEPKNYLDFLQDAGGKVDSYHHENIAKNILHSDDSEFCNQVDAILKDILKKFPKLKENDKINEDDSTSYRKLIGNIIRGSMNYTASDIFIKKDENGEIKRDSSGKHKLDDSKVEKYNILSKIINSNLDADQMDYMCRDTQNTGIQHSVRVDFLIDNMNICYKNFPSDNDDVNKRMLCFDYGAVLTIEQFLLSKFYWYTEILNYNRAFILNRIAQRLNTYYLLTHQEKLESYNDLYIDKDKFFFFTDSVFWDRVKWISETTESIIVKRLINMLINGTAPKAVNEADFKNITRDAGHDDAIYQPRLKDQKKPTKSKKKFYRDIVNQDKKYFPVILEKELLSKDTTEDIDDYTSDCCINILKSCQKDKCLDCSTHKIEGFNEINKDGIAGQLDKQYFSKTIIFDFSELIK